VYKYRNAAKELHEYLADEGAINAGIAEDTYQKLLFEQATGVSMLALVNSFSYSLIKSRLVMLTKIRSSKVAKARMLMALPIVMVLLVVFACNKSNQSEVQNTDPVLRSVLDKAGNKTEEVVFFEVDNMPQFEGGDSALRDFIASHVKYPKEAKEDGIQGRVFVQFVVSKNGKVEQVKVVRGVHDLLDKEALRVISALPDWKPGMKNGKCVTVSFTVPINFQLD
nr:M56 family metallopeptidase [Salinivirgaceae bacterium]